jgi:hypothetical protein
VVGEALTRARTRFAYHGSELMAPYGYFLADLPIVPADLSQQAKSAAADGLTYSDSTDKKVRKI